MKVSLRLNAKILPAIGTLAFVMQIIDPSRVWMIVLTGIGGAWLFCWWWARGLARALTFNREVRFGWAQVGDRLEERFTLTNQFTLPATWVTVQDHSNLPDHHSSVATGVDALSTSQWKVQNRCIRRGVFTLGGTTLETGDPLGIYTLTLEDSTSSTLAVMPPVVSLPNFHIASGGWAGDGRTRPSPLEERIDASHIREMTPNDPMKWIHWKSTAKQNKFFVRQFEGAPAGDWWILLDLNKDIQVGSGWDSTEEHAVILASSLVSRGLAEEHPVGMVINGKDKTWIVPRRNEYQQKSLLKALAVAAPSEMDLTNYLARIGSTIGGQSSLLIITADTNSRWTEALLPMVWRGVMTTVFLLDPVTYGGTNRVTPLESVCQSIGITCHSIPKELLDNKQVRPGVEGEWEWRVSGTGKAIAVRTPVADWRRLG